MATYTETPARSIDISHKKRYIVAPMVKDDIEQVAAIEAKSNSLPWNPNAYVTELENSNAFYVIVKSIDGDVLGFGGIWVIIDELHVTTIAVDPNHRGKKIGERLLCAMIEESIKRGATRATLEVRQSNKIAHSLYRKYRFEDVAIRKAYYGDNGENAVIMWAEDIASADYQQMLYQYRTQFDK